MQVVKRAQRALRKVAEQDVLLGFSLLCTDRFRVAGEGERLNVRPSLVAPRVEWSRLSLRLPRRGLSA